MLGDVTRVAQSAARRAWTSIRRTPWTAAMALALVAPLAGPGVAAAHGARAMPSATAAVNVPAIAAKVDPAVVNINVTGVALDTGFGGPLTVSASGTGMILTPSGIVLTNNHVVEGATRITVQVEGHARPYVARVLGVDPSQDVALLQLEGASHLPTVKTAAGERVVLGEPVVAIGNAAGLGGKPTVTEGTITGLNRTITASGDFTVPEHLTGLLETDAPLAPGDSGGPLVDAEGRVIGMDTAAFTGGSASAPSDIGFAIPIGRALAIAHQIEAKKPGNGVQIGQVAFLGIEAETLPAGAELNGVAGPGVAVVAVIPGTPAALTGLQPYDVIIGFDGHKVTSAQQLTALITALKPGDRATVTWLVPNPYGFYGSSGTAIRQSATVTLGVKPVA